MTKAVVLSEPCGEIEVRDVELAPPGPAEIRVRVAASGVCHSDLHLAERGAAAGAVYPMVLGHEAAGEVIELGPGVTDFEVGDHVILCVVPQCGECAYCSRGHPTLCVLNSTGFRGTLPDGTTRLSVAGQPIGQASGIGSWSEEVVVSTFSAVKIPESMPLAPAALIGCGVVTGYGAVANVSGLQAGQTMAVLGCGGLGLNAVQAGRISGASQIIAIDLNSAKLRLATQVGATHTIDASSEDVAQRIAGLTDGLGVDVSFDFVTNGHTARQALALARRGGTAVLTGVAEEQLEFSLTDVVRSGRTIKGNLMGMGRFSVDFLELVRLYGSGELLLDELVSQTLPLEDFAAAFEALKGDVARSVLVMS